MVTRVGCETVMTLFSLRLLGEQQFQENEESTARLLPPTTVVLRPMQGIARMRT